MDEIRRYVRADSLGYLSLEGLAAAVEGGKSQPADSNSKCDNYCHACFSGDYPVVSGDDDGRRRLVLAPTHDMIAS